MTASLVEVGPSLRLAANAEGIVGLLREQASTIEELGTLPRNVVQAIDDAGLYRMAIPAASGGTAPVSVVERVAIFTQLGRGNASAGWSVMNNLVNALDVTNFGDETAAEVYGTDHVGPLVAGSGPNRANALAFAERVDGGYQVHGRWGFASNIRLAPWLSGSVIVTDEDGTETTTRMLLPRPDFRIADDWHVLGLAGSNSNTAFVLEAEKVFVPERRVWADPSYIPGGFLEAMLDFAAITVGVADGALEVFIEKAARRAPMQLAYGTMGEMATAHAMVGRMSARIGLASTALKAYGELIDSRRPELTRDEVAKMEFESVVIANDMRDIVHELRNAMGSSTAARTDLLGIFAHDVATMCLHGLFRLDWATEGRGRTLFGLEKMPAPRKSSSQVGTPPPMPSFRELEETDERAIWFRP